MLAAAARWTHRTTPLSTLKQCCLCRDVIKLWINFLLRVVLHRAFTSLFKYIRFPSHAWPRFQVPFVENIACERRERKIVDRIKARISVDRVHLLLLSTKLTQWSTRTGSGKGVHYLKRQSYLQVYVNRNENFVERAARSAETIALVCNWRWMGRIVR